MEAFERPRFRAIVRLLAPSCACRQIGSSVFVFDLNYDEKIAHSTGQPWNRRERSA
jgi:hypothetical protein